MIHTIKTLLNNNELLQKLTGPSFWVLLMKLANQGLNFLIFIVLARLIGVTEFGYYILAWSWARILLNFSKFGLDLAGTKYFPAFHTQKNWEAIRSFYRYGTFLIWGKSILVIALGILTLWMLTQWTDFKGAEVYVWAFLSLPFWSLLMFMQPLLRAFDKTIRGLIPEMLLRPFVQLIAIGAIVAVGAHLDAEYAMIITNIAFVIAWAVNAVMTQKTLRPLPFNERNASTVVSKEWYYFAITLVLISSGGVVFRQADTVMLGALSGAEDAGIYGASTRIANLVTFILTSVNLVAGTLISRFHHSGQKEKLQNLLTMASALIFAGTILISTLLWFVSVPVMSLFGPAFVEGVWPLRWLLFGQVINALSGPVGYLMTLTGHHKEAAWIFAAMIVVNIVLNFLLIPMMGMNGAAIATAISTALWNIILCVFVMKVMKLDATIFSLWRLCYAKT